MYDPTYFRKLAGKFNFLTNTRLDIAYGVQHLSQIMHKPRQTHLQVTIHMLRYLKKDPTLGIFLSNKFDYNFRTYCDSDWAACPDSRWSVSGYIVLLGDSLINWKSQKYETIFLSSAEVEYKALGKVAGELTCIVEQAFYWVWHFLSNSHFYLLWQLVIFAYCQKFCLSWEDQA